ncbi:HAD family hydrolase [Glaciecola petra]|uniref:HAD-IA family hydrolase n=1 Tax=Glaciecola petra TaxID=3075602 RepID=A0ABU2ZSL4_9ALTE|nr:HAD-IA family hydrolase [Aestuariibacter sp. P117]MDT0595634.1 HAD-IA family hydrolase [Aestuariibacter sp. P117]
MSEFSFSKVSAIIFDLDDTLVKTSLDFAKLKKEIACPANDDILTFIAQIKEHKARQQAEQKVLLHELQDAESSAWLPQAQAFVDAAKRYGLPLSIVTRNCREATNIKLRKNNIPISKVLTREDAPPKPDPSALLSIANDWQIPCEKIAYIGDYIYDIQAAHNANMQAWLYKQKNIENDYTFGECLHFIPK